MTSFLIKSFLFLGVSCFVANAALLGGSECTYGPSFWCSSLRNAKQCSAVTHCIQTVWEKQVLPEDNDDICSICKNMVQQARDVLQSNQTQEELKQVFEGSYRLIPIREITKECIELADDFIPELIETLASQMNPQIVCATAGLCNSASVDRLLAQYGLEHTNKVVEVQTPAPVQKLVQKADPNQDCRDCHKFVQDTIQLVKQHSKQELMDHLLAICGELGSISDGCSALVMSNLDVIYNFLTNDLNADELCTLFGMCGDLFGHVSRPAITSGDEACDFCVVIAQHWRDVLTSDSTKEEFKEVLVGLCKQSGSFKDECIALVDTYYEGFYNWLVNDFNPKQLCETVGICKDIADKPVWTAFHTGPNPLGGMLIGTDEANANKLMPRVPLTPSIKPTDSPRAPLSPSILPRAPLKPSVKVTVAGESGVLVNGDQACTMCEFTLHFIQNELQDKATREEIENAVKNVCTHLPQNLREQCDDYVDAYGDQVIALLEQQIDPSVVCPLIGLCPRQPEAVQVSAPDVTCVACEYIMVQLKEILGDKTNQDAVRTALDKVCHKLPRSMSSECQSFVDNNAIEVMQLISAGVQPEAVCNTLGLCSDHNNHLPPLDGRHQLPLTRLFVPSVAEQSQAVATPKESGQSKVCVMCEFAISMLDQYILNNKTEESVSAAMERLCLLFPSTLQEDCLGFMEQYSKSIIQLVVSDLEPKMVCQELTLCQPPNFEGLMAAVLSAPHRMTKRSAGSTNHESCIICRAIFNFRRPYPNPDQPADNSVVTAFCNDLETTRMQEKCHKIKGSMTVEVASQHSEAQDACSNDPHTHCSSGSGLIGSQPCVWGPSYWCASRLNAQSCGATAHCDRVGWA